MVGEPVAEDMIGCSGKGGVRVSVVTRCEKGEERARVQGRGVMGVCDGEGMTLLSWSRRRVFEW